MGAFSIDPPPCFEGETLREHVASGCAIRCRHDMVAEWCAICLHQPDVVIDFGADVPEFDQELGRLIRVDEEDDHTDPLVGFGIVNIAPPKDGDAA